MKVWIVGQRVEVLVNHGVVRVILRDGKGPSTVVEDELLELQVEETVKEVRGGWRAEAGVERGGSDTV